LAEVFGRVVATDASTDQVGAAVRHPGIEYRVEPAERVSLETHSVDLVTAATAVHWFDLEAFYAEARRVLKLHGVLAVWSYSLPHIEPQVDSLVRTLVEGVLQGYWPDEVRSLFRLYQNLPFPFAEVGHPEFSMVTEWDLGSLLGFIDSWSGTQIFLEREGRHPLESLAGDLERAWGAPGAVRQARWPLFMRVGVQSAGAGQAQPIVEQKRY
jgi:SAM-dependent methyltransferase